MDSKRLHYSAGTDSSISDTDSQFSMQSQQYNHYKNNNTSKRKPKSSTKNALMARQNRLKKKKYIENLERELMSERNKGKKMKAMVKQHVNTIEKQERELRYMNSVLANNTDISRLLRSIHTNTGMCVATSVNPNLFIPKEESHPWEPKDDVLLPLPPLEPDSFDLPSNIDEIPSLDNIFQSDTLPSAVGDHNYTITSEQKKDVGVCLYVSNHKVSLEFCGTCYDKAKGARLSST